MGKLRLVRPQPKLTYPRSQEDDRAEKRSQAAWMRRDRRERLEERAGEIATVTWLGPRLAVLDGTEDADPDGPIAPVADLAAYREERRPDSVQGRRLKLWESLMHAVRQSEHPD